MAKRIKSYYPVTTMIDGDSVLLHLRRMSTIQIEAFESQMKMFGYSFDGSKVTPPTEEVDGKVIASWLVDVISQNVTVAPGELILEEEDGTTRELRTGAELIAQYGGRVDFVPTLIAYVWGENRLPEDRKELFRQLAAEAVAQAGGYAPVPTMPVVEALPMLPDVAAPEPEPPALTLLNTEPAGDSRLPM